MASTRSCGVTSASAFFSSSSFFSDLRLDLAPASAARMRGDLPLLELGLREDVAVHLHEHLLDDLAPRIGRRRSARDEDDGVEKLLHKFTLNYCNSIF